MTPSLYRSIIALRVLVSKVTVTIATAWLNWLSSIHDGFAFDMQSQVTVVADCPRFISHVFPLAASPVRNVYGEAFRIRNVDVW